MPFIAESRKRLGFLAFWHHGFKKDGFQLDERANILGVDIKSVHDQPGQTGEYETEKDCSDLTGFTEWKRNTRQINGTRTIWPCVVVDPNGATTAGPDDPGGWGPTTPGGGTSTTDQGYDEMGRGGATTPGGGSPGGGAPAGEVGPGNGGDGYDGGARYAPPGYGEPPPQLDGA